MIPKSPDPKYQSLIEKALEAGQGHVFAWWDELNGQERLHLLQQLAEVDFELMERLFRDLVRPAEEVRETAELIPPSVIPLARTREEASRDARARAVGEDILFKGSLAVLIVAGGQASRMGVEVPKGCVPVSPIMEKPLFQLHAEKVLALSLRYGISIPLIVMTSWSNDEPTREFFRENDYFGLNTTDVSFAVQASLPALDPDGKIILETKSSLFFSPDGHGGAVQALKASGALDNLLVRGINDIFYLQVDNPLVKIGDPVFLGYHTEAGAEVSLKVVHRRSPEEKVGVLVWRDGKIVVVEYTDLSKEQKHARDPSGELKFCYGSIAIHVLSTRFLKRLAEGEGGTLPYHAAWKKVPFVDASGNVVRPDKPNAIKFERFIFDALPFASAAAAIETSREEEFAPVKEMAGEDSPQNARRAMSELYVGWLKRCGIEVPRDDDGSLRHPVEISPLFAMNADDLATRLRRRHFKVASPLYVGPDFLSRRGMDG